MTTPPLHQVRILRSLAHPYIVSLHYAFDDSSHMYLALTYAGGGDLLAMLEEVGPFAEAVARHAFAEAVAALCHLHVMRILYR